MIIATAGHVDHGKTTLLQAITGVNADRLPEEITRDDDRSGVRLLATARRSRAGVYRCARPRKVLSNMLAGWAVLTTRCWWWPAMMA